MNRLLVRLYDQPTCMSRIQLSMMACLFVRVYSSHAENIGKARIGCSQKNVALSNVIPLGVGHVSLGCKPSGPGTSNSSSSAIISNGSKSSSSVSDSSDVSRFFLLNTTHKRGLIISLAHFRCTTYTVIRVLCHSLKLFQPSPSSHQTGVWFNSKKVNTDIIEITTPLNIC